jgi:hypothetical protein
MEKKKSIKYNILCKGNNEDYKKLLKKTNFRKQFFSPLSNNNNTRLTNDTSFNNDETNKFKSSSKKLLLKNDILLMNKTYFNSEKINKKYKTLINSKTRKKLKYLDNNELNYIFSEGEIYNNSKLLNNENDEKHKIYLSSSSLSNQNHNKKKYIINFSKDSSNKAVLDANLKNNKFNFSPDDNEKRNNKKKKNSIKRFSVTALFALKIMDPSEVLEEHIDSSLKINNKFGRFKLMLKKQKDKNIKLLNSIKEDRVMNENMLKVYVNQITKKHLGYQ